MCSVGGDAPLASHQCSLSSSFGNERERNVIAVGTEARAVVALEAFLHAPLSRNPDLGFPP